MKEINDLNELVVQFWKKNIGSFSELKKLIIVKREIVRAHCGDPNKRTAISRDVIDCCSAIDKLQHCLENLIDSTK